MANQTSESIASFPKLGEDNYSSWSKNMKAYLMQKKVWAIVKGTDIKPSPGDAELRDWLKDEQLAAGVIYLGLEEGQKSQVEDILDDPKQMWEELESIHVQKRPSTRFNAYNSLLSIMKLEEESLPALTSRIEKAMQEVKNLRPATFTLSDLDSVLESLCVACGHVCGLPVWPSTPGRTWESLYHIWKELWNDTASRSHYSTTAIHCHGILNNACLAIVLSCI